jgi:hypothetical protein
VKHFGPIRAKNLTRRKTEALLLCVGSAGITVRLESGAAKALGQIIWVTGKDPFASSGVYFIVNKVKCPQSPGICDLPTDH